MWIELFFSSYGPEEKDLCILVCVISELTYDTHDEFSLLLFDELKEGCYREGSMRLNHINSSYSQLQVELITTKCSGRSLSMLQEQLSSLGYGEKYEEPVS